MKNWLKFTVLFSILLLNGCVVQSLNPFCIEDVIKKSPEFDGQWYLVKEMGEDVSDDSREAWVIKGDLIQTFDENGVGSKLKITFFEIENTLFLDTYPDYPKEECSNFWWNCHVIPILLAKL